MKNVLFLSDGSDIALACAKALATCGVKILAIVVGPSVGDSESRAIVGCFDPAPPLIQTARPDRDPQIASWAAAGTIDLLLVVYFEYRVRADLIKAAKFGGITVHPSVLPHNGGFHTSFWGIVNQTPLGATLLWLDEGLDTGGVIAQKSFADDGLMTATEVRARQRQMCAELFEENINSLIAGRIPWTTGQPCSYHFKTDIVKATTFNEDEQLTLSQLLRLGRATFHGENGLVVEAKNGDRFRLSISVCRLPPKGPN